MKSAKMKRLKPTYRQCVPVRLLNLCSYVGLRYYIQALFDCLTGLTTEIPAKWFDYCDFWRDKITPHSCHYTCGLAREAGAVIIRKARPDQFLADGWLNALNSFETNQSVVGFMVEQTCLSAISALGFNHRGLHWDPVPSTVFSGDIFRALPLKTSRMFYVPEQWNYKCIDALYLDCNMKKKHVLIVPIQICLNRFHKDSEALFYSDWERWENRFEGYKISTTFVWIVEHKRSWKLIERQLRSSRSRPQLITPQHRQIHITAGEVFEPLGPQLKSRYLRLKHSNNLPPELMFGSDDEDNEPKQLGSNDLNLLPMKKTQAKTRVIETAKV